MTLETLGNGSLDYLPCRYGNSKLLFRGPRRDLNAPYIAFLGGTETYGKFIAEPFVDKLDRELNATCVNFGYLNAGVDVFLNDPFLPMAASKARITVLQVSGTQNMSNRLYSVHPRRNDRFVEPTRMMKSIYPDVDFAAFHFNKHMLGHLRALSPDRYRIVEDELREAWTARTNNLVKRISGKIVLLWLSMRSPDDADNLDADPLHITRDMLNDVRPNVTELVEVIPSAAAIDAGQHGMIFSQMETPVAREMMGPVVHEEVADALQPVLQEML